MAAGQIYVPFTNWTLYLAVMALVFGFQSSSNLAAAYGIAVTGTMMIDTILVSFVVLLAWRWNPWLAVPLLGGLLLVDFAFFSANAIKILQGGWFPIVMAFLLHHADHLAARPAAPVPGDGQLTMPLDEFMRSIATLPLNRVSSTAVYLTSRPEGAPSPCCTTSSTTRCCTPATFWSPCGPPKCPMSRSRTGSGHRSRQHFYRVSCAMASWNSRTSPRPWRPVARRASSLTSKTSFFLSREVVVPKLAPPMMLWRELFFIWMLRNAQSATDFFRIPTNRVVDRDTGRDLTPVSSMPGRALVSDPDA